MPNTKTAKKQFLVNVRNRARNVRYKTRMKNAIKTFRAAIEMTEDPEVTREKLILAQRVINVSASKGIIKKQTASRKISRLYSLFNKKFAYQSRD